MVAGRLGLWVGLLKKAGVSAWVWRPVAFLSCFGVREGGNLLRIAVSLASELGLCIALPFHHVCVQLGGNTVAVEYVVVTASPSEASAVADILG